MVDFEQFGREVASAVSDFADNAAQFGSEVGETVSGASNDLMRGRRFAELGRDLFMTSAVTSHGGNLSESDGNSIWITRRDSMLGHLGSKDVVTTLWDEGTCDELASRELIVHRMMYHAFAQRESHELGTFAAAIVHAHTRYTIAASLLGNDTIVPLDSEGIFTFGEGIKVLAPVETIGSAEAASLLGEAVYAGANIAVIKGHGPFAIAPSLRDAWRLVSVLEASCEIAYLLGKGK